MKSELFDLYEVVQKAFRVIEKIEVLYQMKFRMEPTVQESDPSISHQWISQIVHLDLNSRSKY